MKSKVLCALFGAFVLAAISMTAGAAPGSSKMSDRALEALANNANDWVDLIITCKPLQWRRSWRPSTGVLGGDAH